MGLVVRDYDPNDSEDAARLAAMFNDFDSAWPGGFTRGVPETADRIRERMARMRRLAVLVADWDGVLVGYCDLEAQPGQTEIAYVDLLGARASHHGKGVGKMLLREIVRRTAALGYKQVTLHTWAGNTKAVPLYKKTGFHWVPESAVFMRNFLPTVLNLPVGREFFAQRDWYECHEREIVIAPDDITWKGMKVYPYRFRAGDESLHLTFGAEGEGLTGIETPAYALSCVIPVEEAAAGETVPISWEITPTAGKPLEVVLLTEADPGLEVSVQERLTVTKPFTLTRDLRIASTAAPRKWGETAHRVRTTLLVDGQPVVFETGVKVVRPVDINYWGEGLFPGRPERILVPIHNNLDRPIAGQVALDPHPAIMCEPAVRPFTVEPRLTAQCEFTVTVREPGDFPVDLRYTAGAAQGSRPVHFRAFGTGGALASIDATYDEIATLETPTLKAAVNVRGGNFWLRDQVRERGLLDQGLAELGPPFVDHRMRPPLLEVRAEHTPAGTSLTLAAPSVEFPGLSVERSISLPGGDLIRVDYRVTNTSDRPQPAQLRLISWPGLGGWLAACTAEGLIREPMHSGGEYPQGEIDLLAAGARFAESWVACEEDGLVCGLVWHPHWRESMRWGRLPHLTADIGEIAAHGSVELPPLYVVGGQGDWRTVRGWWRRLVQPSGVHEAAPPEPGRVLEVRFEPSPALLFTDRQETLIAVHNRRGKPLDGTLRLQGSKVSAGPYGPGAGFQAEPDQFTLQNLDRDHPFAAPVTLSAPPSPAAGFLTITVDGGPTTETRRVPVVRLGDSGTVCLTEGENRTIRVDNGCLTLRIAPEFQGAIYALEWNSQAHPQEEAVNHLLTAYPEKRPFVWANPWYGGIHPFLGWIGDPRLSREKFSGGPTERTGERGIRWQGARIACEPQHKDLRWLRLEAEYLTTPGSNVVALLSRWTNRNTARMTSPGDVGMAAWAQVGGTREHTTVHWERHGEARQRRRSNFSAEGRSGHRVALENTHTGDLLTLINTTPRGYTYFEDFGEEGMHLLAAAPLEFEPGESKETLTWLVMSRERAQIDAYGAALSQLARLP